MNSPYFLPRDLHPAAWWVWALGLATAASRTTNPWLLALILVVACHVVVARRSDAPWAMSFRLYLYLGGLIIVLRVLFRFIFSGSGGPTVLISLPEIPLPDFAAGINLFGDITAESLLGGFYDGLRLATILICLGAANALANPKRLLKSMPPALYEIATAIVVAITVFPQLADSIVRVNRARKLRGVSGKKLHVLKAVVIPVLEDALDRSMSLAASMDSRGYGRAGNATARARLLTGTLMIAGLVGVCVGTYASLDATTPRYLATPVLMVGTVVAVAGFVLAGRRVQRTSYRPDTWQGAEIVTALAGLACAFVLLSGFGFDDAVLFPSLTTVSWPQLSLIPVAGVLCAVLPAFFTPAPAHTHVDHDNERRQVVAP